jgi:lysosomal alpha-glucosidase
LTEKIIDLYFQQNQKEVDAYLPDDIWYELKGEDLVRAPKTGNVKLTDRATGPPPIHFRGGSILPFMDRDKDVSNTDVVRKHKFFLTVIPNKMITASGDLFWDDGESINTIESGKYNYYTFKLYPNCSLEIDVIKSGYDMSSEPQVIDNIFIVNTSDIKIEPTVDGKKIEYKHQGGGTLLMVNIDLHSKKAGEKWVISWRKPEMNACNIM